MYKPKIGNSHNDWNFGYDLLDGLEPWKMIMLPIASFAVLLALLFLNDITGFAGKSPSKKIYDVALNDRLDSVVIGNRVHKIFVGGNWYDLHNGYYTTFAEFVVVNDTIMKGAKRWDIRVKRNSGNKKIVRYFKGAQGAW